MHKTHRMGLFIQFSAMAIAAVICNACVSAQNVADEAANGLRVRVGTYNTEGGQKPGQILANLRKFDADVICVQEVVNSQTQLKMYARALGMNVAFGPYHPHGASGVAVMAHGKVSVVKTFTMEGERAFGVAAKVRVRGQEMLVVSLHLKSLPRPLVQGALSSMDARSKQAREIIAWTKKQTLPTIVAGDCNSLTFFPEYLTLSNAFVDACRETKTQHEPTIFVAGMGYRIDHIFATNGSWTVKSCQAPTWEGSDHRPVMAELRLGAPTSTASTTSKATSQPATESSTKADKK